MTALNRNHRQWMWILLAAMLPVFSGAAYPQDQIREYVQVSEVELTVRVMDKRRMPVAGLTAEDFSITENGLPVPITSCTEIHRRISSGSAETSLPRLFLVYFWVWQENKVYPQALDELFNRIYREGDTVVLSLPTNTRVIQSRAEIPSARREFEKDLHEWTRQQTLRMEGFVSNLNRLLKDFIDSDRLMYVPNSDWGFRRAFETFKNSVQSDWKSFRSSFLDIPNRNFQRLAELLRGIKHQKWGIVFLQPSTFPMVHPNALIWTRFENANQAQQLRSFANDMIRVMHSPHQAKVQIQALEQAFIRGNTTFHIVRMDARRDETDAEYDLVMQEVFSDRQWTFQRLAQVTGGRIITDNIPGRGLRHVAEAEDVYYRLTYRPARHDTLSDDDHRNLVISSSRRDVVIHHARSMRLSEVEEIRLAEFHSDSTRVKFILTGYAVRMEGERLRSDIHVSLTAESPRGLTQTYSRNFQTPEPFLQVSMAVRFPRSGHYRLHFYAEDRFTGISVKESQLVQVILPHDSGVQETPGDKQP